MAAEPTNGTKPTPIATSLVRQYKHEFQEQYNNVRCWLRDNSKELKDYVTELKQLLQEAEDDPAKRLKMGIVQPLKNLTNIGIADAMLIETFAWITILMFFFWIGHNVCSAMFNPILSILLTNTQMAALAFIIPIIAHRTIEIGNDVKSRFNLQMFAALHGIVTGYTFKNYHLHLPLPFIVPLFIAAAAAAAYFIARKTTSRIQFLSISLLAGFLANCLLGWIIAGLTFSYLLAAIMQTLVALVTIQYYFDIGTKIIRRIPISTCSSTNAPLSTSSWLCSSSSGPVADKNDDRWKRTATEDKNCEKLDQTYALSYIIVNLYCNFPKPTYIFC